MKVSSAPRFAGLAIPLLALATLGACAEDSKPIGYEVQVAPLDLPNVSDACYSLTVYNSESTFDATTTVWSQTDICASQYGDGSGSITYIGTCDASVPNNTVELVLEGLYTGAASDEGGLELGAADFQNPCTSDDPAHTCRLVRPCVENADTLVEFNLTIMRSAQQGFFDIAVNFEDIFCSAKVDCLGSDDEPLDLLFNEDGERDSTAVMAFSCTAGEGADTTLYLSDTYIVCDHDSVNGTFLPPDYVDPDPDNTSLVAQLSPNAGPGNAGSPAPGIFQYAVYNDREDLPGINGQFSTMAIGFDDSFFTTTFNGEEVTRSCYLVAWGSATDGVWPAAQTPLGSTTPFVSFVVPLNPPATPGGEPQTTLSCGRHPMDAEGSGVRTTYDPVAYETCFENVVDGNWEDVDGEIDVNHFTQWQHDFGQQWFPYQLEDGLAGITSWQATGSPTISRCEENWDYGNRFGAATGPIDYDDDNGTIIVNACRDEAPFNGKCDVGETRIAGAPFRATSGLQLPANHMPGFTVSATSDGSGVATLTNLLPGNYQLTLAAFAGEQNLFCAGTGLGFNWPNNSWPMGFGVGTPQDTTSFDFAVRCR